MPSSMAVCMILTASALSLTSPMCQPPRQMMDTFSPVLPRGRVGRPADGLSSPGASAAMARAAVPARPAWRNSRRDSEADMNRLLGWKSSGATPKLPRRGAGDNYPVDSFHFRGVHDRDVGRGVKDV